MAAISSLPPVQTALETYLGFLDTSDSTTEKESSVTPNIERFLRDHRQRQTCEEVGRGKQRKTAREKKRGGASSSNTASGNGKSEGDYELRLMELEKQLSGLLHRTKNVQRKATKTHQSILEDNEEQSSTSTSSGSCDESCDEDPPESVQQPTLPSKPHAKTENVSAQSLSTSKQQRKVTSRNDRVKRKTIGGVRTTMAPSGSRASGSLWDKNGRRQQQVLGNKEEGESSRKNVVVVRESSREKRGVGRVGGVGRGGGGTGGGGGDIGKVSSIQQDHKVKTQLVMETQKQLETKQNSTQLKTVSQLLEEEKERREKAEKAASTLVEHIRSLQTQLSESKRDRELAIVKSSKLDTELKKEREERVMREEDGKKIQSLLTAAQKELELVKEKMANKERILREKEEENRQRDIEHKTEKLELLGRVRAAELDLSGQQRETEILQKSLIETKRQLQQMQELLATRERDHLRAVENCKSLDGHEVQELVRCRVEQERKKTEEVVDQHRERLGDQQKAYKALEDEFRMALRIEASRYQELRGNYEAVQRQVEEYQSTAESAMKKEQKATQMVAKLTSIVREQRGRLSELSRLRQDTTAELRERVSELEVKVREKHKLEVKLESLLEDNFSLSSQLTAQQSVLEGLRGERELWSRELAQQGAELAQDRGRMEAQIETLTNENLTLREDLQSARDAVRVKEKIMADQQNTISQLKDSLAGKDREGEEARQDWEREQQSLHIQLEQEQEASVQLQDELTKALERKVQLKEELSTVKDELANCQQKYSKLRGELEERVKVITGLEDTLTQVQTTFSERETVLSREKNEAVERAVHLEKRLKENETVHQQQLESQKASHDSHISKIIKMKHKEIEAANQKVKEVEGEMRELLVEVAKEKKAMDVRAHRLSAALQQLQQDFNH